MMVRWMIGADGSWCNEEKWSKNIMGSAFMSVVGQMSGDLRISFSGHRTDGMDMGFISGHGYVDFRT